MLPKVFSFVDVETNGMSAVHGRIIEIGIIRVEDNKVVDTYSTLINPNSYVDSFILSMTGIAGDDLQNAPSFYEVKDRIKELLIDSMFIAHNVAFDYSFIKKEFERIEETFSSKYCCSVKLSRNLYPDLRHHNLDAIIERFNLTCTNRHRALDDAKVIWDFYKLALKNFGEERLIVAFKNVLKRPSLPIGVTEEILDSLPDRSGVYIFYSKENTPLYVGKSKNIRTRVRSHFSSSKGLNVDMKIAQNINRIETIETAGELGALLLEATLVKKMQPLYNRQLRYAAKLLALKKNITPNSYNCVSVSPLDEIPIEQLAEVLGIFRSKSDLKRFLVALAKAYTLCPKLLGLEKVEKNCFNYHLGLCKGGCLGDELVAKYNLRFEEAFYKTKIKNWPFKGPIAIKEKSSKEEIFIIDKWCVLGTLKDSSQSLDDISRDYSFDTDTYKILTRYLNEKKDLEIFNLKNR